MEDESRPGRPTGDLRLVGRSPTQLRLALGSGRDAAAAAIPLAIGLFFASITLWQDGVRLSRVSLQPSLTAGWSLTAGFVILSAIILVATGYREWHTLDRERGQITTDIGVLWPLWRRVRPLAIPAQVRLVPSGGKSHLVVESACGRVALGYMSSPQGAKALAAEIAAFLAEETKPIRQTRPTYRRKAGAAPEPVPADIEIVVLAGRVTLRVGYRSASWVLAAAVRGHLEALTPAKGAGEIVLETEDADGSRTLRLSWDRYEPAIWQTLRERAEDLDALFVKGLVIREGADA